MRRCVWFAIGMLHREHRGGAIVLIERVRLRMFLLNLTDAGSHVATLLVRFRGGSIEVTKTLKDLLDVTY